MVIITKARLSDFYGKEPNAKEPLIRWYQLTLLSDWHDLHDVKETFNSAGSIGNDRYVFNISGNRYRIVTMIHFNTRTVYIRFVGTHKEYDRIHCKTV